MVVFGVSQKVCSRLLSAGVRLPSTHGSVEQLSSRLASETSLPSAAEDGEGTLLLLALLLAAGSLLGVINRNGADGVKVGDGTAGKGAALGASVSRIVGAVKAAIVGVRSGVLGRALGALVGMPFGTRVGAAVGEIVG